MIGSTRQVAVYAYAAPVDLRKGYDGLYGLVANELGKDPLAGDFFLFISRNRRRAKVLLWDGTGLCIYAKRLERGRFVCLWREEGTGPLRLTINELQLFLEGSKAIGQVVLSPPRFIQRSLASIV
jgi:transposase